MNERAGLRERIRSAVENKRLQLRLGATALVPALAFNVTACGNSLIPDRTRNIRDIPDPTTFCPGQYERTGEFSAPAGMVLVDPRCAPDPNKPVIIYGDSETTGEKLATAKAGATFETVCYENGEDIANAAGESSGKWIRVILEKTYPESSLVERTRPYTSHETAFISATLVNGTNGPEQVWDPCDTEPAGNPSKPR